jgi:chemotaxis methyl-accepting protein methylase
MNPLARQASQPFTGMQIHTVLQHLRERAGITIESPQFVIEQNLLERMAVLEISDPADYLAVLEDGINARAEWLALIDLMTVKETRFFRQPAAMDLVADYTRELMAQADKPQQLSFWSAGCSTGQELYSLAMVVEQVLMEHDPWCEWHGIGTDMSFQAINVAQRGEYIEAAVRTLPLKYRHPFLRKSGEDSWEVCDSIQARTHFFHSNLLHVNDAPFADFNLIFCQNVLIYFDRPTQLWIIDQLAERLQTGGLLILGAGEDVHWKNSNMQRLQRPGVCAYKKTGGLADGC